LTNEIADPAGDVKVKDLHNPVYDATEREDKENGKEAVYPQPDTKGKAKDQKLPGAKGGDEQEREFQNSIYGHDLVSISYSKPTSSNTPGQNSATAPNEIPPHQQSTSTGPVQNGEATYAMVEESNYDTAYAGNSQCYDMTHASTMDEHYDVAHLPDDDQYDVAHPPASQTTPSNQDANHLLDNMYDVVHPAPGTSVLQGQEDYDVAHLPLGTSGLQGQEDYDVVHPAPGTSGLQGQEVYDVAHPLPGTSGLQGQEDYDVAHPLPGTSGLQGQEVYNVAYPPPGTSGLQGQEDYDVIQPLPCGNNYEMVDGQGDYDVATVPVSVDNGSGLGHLQENLRYERMNLPTTH